MNLKKYFAEHRRRNVFKAGIAYLAVACVVAEVASVVFPTFNLPEYFLKVLLIILIIGFPINLVFGWISDNREGYKKKVDFDQQVQKSKLSGNRLNRVIIVALSVAVILLVFNQFRNTPGNKKGKVNSNVIVETAIEDEKSIAVLPLRNLSGDPDHEAFCEGMTTAIISRLSKISSLGKVIPHTSMLKYKETDKSAPEIANELGVSHILEGDFQKQGNTVKIDLRLIEAATNDIIWTDELLNVFNDKFKIQADVAQKVAEKLDVRVTDTEMKSIRKEPTNNEEAYKLFLTAEFQKNKSDKRGLENAKPLYEDAIALDSNFIEAYIGLGNTWIRGGLVWGLYNEEEAWGHGKTLFLKALEIDSTIVHNKHLLYSGYFYFEWDFELIEKHYHAIMHQPIVDHNYAYVDYSIKNGRYNEALENTNKRIQFDPTFGVNYSFKANILLLQGKRDEAIDILERSDLLYRDDYFYLREAAKWYFYLEEYEKSRNHLNRLMNNFEGHPPNPILLWLNAVLHHLDDNSREAQSFLAKLNVRYENNASGSPAWFLALYYCTLEDYETAFIWLQKSFDRHEVEMTWFREEPLLIPIRDDQRYKDLYRNIGFPDRSIE